MQLSATGMLAQFGNGTVTVPAAACATTNLTVTTSVASGSFECVNQMGMNQNGAIVTDVEPEAERVAPGAPSGQQVRQERVGAECRVG
jgi:hypothetical protein